MKALKIPFFASADDIIKEAEKHSKHKKFAFGEWPDGFPYGSIRLIVMNKDETVDDLGDFDEVQRGKTKGAKP